ncbi:site-2 protease family protein [Candidatus Saccharibacteria bacterium]|jgi:Zn-dependent protease|nr:site-2 protease family protein [Candidatus Saccharibacteria bacterium]MBP9131536.1 site-2 protease family protein [Candidatus Saccharibacteria bacterium]
MSLIIYIIVTIVIVLLSVTLHEAMHAYASYWLGDDTAFHSGRLTLNPIAHLDPFLSFLLPLGLAILGLPIFGGAKPVPFNPFRLKYGDWGPAIVAVAGPLTNLVLAIVSGVWLRFINIPNDTVLFTLQLFVQVNLGFFVFNMLPIPPLDGSRVLYALSPESVRRVIEGIERNSVLLVFMVVILFRSQLSLLIVGVMSPLFKLITGDSLNQFFILMQQMVQ